jgi:Tol biopolymer transport system component
MNRAITHPFVNRHLRISPQPMVLIIAAASILSACGDSVSPGSESIPVDSVESTDVPQEVDDTVGTSGSFNDTAVLSAFENESDSEIWLVDGNGSNLRKVTDNNENDLDPMWFPDRSKILFRRFNEEVQGTSFLELWVMNPDGSNERRLAEGLDTGGEWTPYSWSPDGNRLVTSGYLRGVDPENNGVGGIYVVEIETGESSKIIDTDNSDLWPSWSPDGSRIAFVQSATSEFELYVVDIDGSNLTRLAEGYDMQSHLRWTSDGSNVIVAAFQDDEQHILSIDVDSNTVLRLGSAKGSAPALSPDGTKLAFWTSEPGNPELWVMNPDGSSPKVVSAPFAGEDGSIQDSGGFGLTWSPDSTRIMFSFVSTSENLDESDSGPSNSFTNLWIVDASGAQAPIKITNGSGPLNGNVTVSWGS